MARVRVLGASDGDQLLRAFLDEMYRWNHRVNLTSVPRESGWQRHVEESLALLAASPPETGARVADVGAGAGVPGIPLAIVRPDLQVVLMEGDQRKAGFLIHVAGLLGLQRVTVAAGRVEELAHQPALRERFDLAVTRAAASPAVICELALPLIRVGGRLVAMVGDASAAAVACARAARLCGGAPPEILDGNLLAVAKSSPSPEGYPRRAGIPGRKPLL